MSWRGLLAARRYFAAATLLELVLLVLGRRVGRVLVSTSLITLFFFRDPERRVGSDPELVYASADGIVVGVEETTDEWLGTAEALRITSFLSLHDVHVTRSPVAGKIVEAEERKGGFAPALFTSRSGGNYQRRLAIDRDARRVVVVQVAGMIARKITSWVGLGTRVAAGQRLGLIHFGSRTDVVLAAGEVDVLVKAGDRVRAGISPLARFREGSRGT